MSSRPRRAANFSMGNRHGSSGLGRVAAQGRLPARASGFRQSRTRRPGRASPRTMRWWRNSRRAWIAPRRSGLPPGAPANCRKRSYAILVPHYAPWVPPAGISPFAPLLRPGWRAVRRHTNRCSSCCACPARHWMIRLSSGPSWAPPRSTLACSATWELAAGSCRHCGGLPAAWNSNYGSMDLRASLLRAFRCEAAGGAEHHAVAETLVEGRRADVQLRHGVH